MTDIQVFRADGSPQEHDITTPATSTDNALVRFDGTTGRAIQDSAATLSDAGTLQTTLIDNTPIGTTTPAAGYFSALREKIGSFFAIFTHSNTADRTYTFPDVSLTVAGRDNAETLTNKTLTTPTIGSFTNAGHNHENAAGGAQLNASNVFSAGVVPLARGGTAAGLSPTSRGVVSLFAADSVMVMRQYGGYEYQQWTMLGGDTASISISSIPSTFNNLLLLLLLRSDRASNTVDGLLGRFNGDTTAANYFANMAFMPSSGFSSVNNLGATATIFASVPIPAATAPTGYFAPLCVWIYNYSITASAQYRSVSWTGGLQVADTAGNLEATAGYALWKNNSNAINSISLAPQNGSNFKAGSGYGLWLF